MTTNAANGQPVDGDPKDDSTPSPSAWSAWSHDELLVIVERQAAEVQRLTKLAGEYGRLADAVNRALDVAPFTSVDGLIEALASRPAIPADAEEGLRTGIGAWLDTENLRELSKEDIVRGAAGAAMGVLEGWAPFVGSDTTADYVPCGNSHPEYGDCFMDWGAAEHGYGQHESTNGMWPVKPGDFARPPVSSGGDTDTTADGGER